MKTSRNRSKSSCAAAMRLFQMNIQEIVSMLHINFNMPETLSPLSILFDCYQNFQIILNIYECDELFLSIQLPNLVD